jgi:hypothetical protein
MSETDPATKKAGEEMYQIYGLLGASLSGPHFPMNRKTHRSSF